MRWTLLLLAAASAAVLAGGEEEEEARYIFYDVNPGEGFNLRRDVFMRVAVMVKRLNDLGKGKFVLVRDFPLFHLCMKLLS